MTTRQRRKKPIHPSRERVARKGRFLSGGAQQMLAIARGLGRIQIAGTPDALRREPAIQQRFLGV